MELTQNNLQALKKPFNTELKGFFCRNLNDQLIQLTIFFHTVHVNHVSAFFLYLLKEWILQK